MDIEKQKELWERLKNEPERAYRAFECYLTLPSTDRTLLEAYRQHVGNSGAAKPSDTWSRWSSEFAWRERAVAYDDHLASVRRDAFERGVEEEAERQGAMAERNRNRMNEMMTVGYEEAMKWLENKGYEEMRASDVIAVIKLHLEAAKTLEAAREPIHEDTWTEDDDAYLIETILPQIEAEGDEDEDANGSREDMGDTESGEH